MCFDRFGDRDKEDQRLMVVSYICSALLNASHVQIK